MNLELLDPFRRQIPDRVDSTLSLPDPLHFRKKVDKKEDDQEWKAANHVAFNRRGTYIAVGYGSGSVGVYDVLSRTLSALYRAGDGEEDSPAPITGHGVTSVSWSRRSRTLLAGAAGDAEVRMVDTTHPFGPEECCLGIVTEENKENDNEVERSQSPSMEEPKNTLSLESSFAKPESTHDHFKAPRKLQIKMLQTSKDLPAKPPQRRERPSHTSASKVDKKRYPSLTFELPQPVGSFLQVHPRDTNAGLAALTDGSLIAFWLPLSGWEEGEENELPPIVKTATIFKSEKHFITCAVFDPQGDRVYAATKEGNLLGFEVATVFDHFAEGAAVIPELKPNFTILVPGGAVVWHLLVSRNGKFIVLNSADAALRLYATKECWMTPEEVEKPLWVFQDVVSKVKFASCDISGDAEFVVGGANGNDNKYELYIWNTSTGALMDKLTGAPVEVYSVAWHPTRSFLAVATSDGLIDIWGPRINWTAFAPDFQALPSNVEYVEREDEFDNDEEENGDEPKTDEDEEEIVSVDVVTVDPVPVFASDSEDEEEVFCFESKITRRIGTFTS
jgi:hypothetical protein